MISEIKGYTSWHQVTRDVVEMDPTTAMMCASPSPRILLPTAKGTKGPHAKKFIRVYVNDVGKEQMTTRKKPRLPVGSVIVKQKLPLLKTNASKASSSQLKQVSSKPELLTVMIKREDGYAPATGDWEYMVTDGTGKKVTARGQIASCQNCHRPYAKADYIVRSYLPKEVMAALTDNKK